MSDRLEMFVILLLAVVVFFVCGDIVNEVGLSATESDWATVVDKTFTEENTTLALAGEAIVPIHHDDKWELLLQVGSETDTVEVTKSFYDSVQVGDQICAGHTRGRLFGDLVITSVR